MGLVFWVFMVLLGLRYRKDGYLLSIGAVIGLIESYLMLSINWTLIGLGMLITSLYLLYDGLMAWT